MEAKYSSECEHCQTDMDLLNLIQLQFTLRAEWAGGGVPWEDAESARGLVERPGQVGAGALAVQAVHPVVAARATPVACVKL